MLEFCPTEDYLSEQPKVEYVDVQKEDAVKIAGDDRELKKLPNRTLLLTNAFFFKDKDGFRLGGTAMQIKHTLLLLRQGKTRLAQFECARHNPKIVPYGPPAISNKIVHTTIAVQQRIVSERNYTRDYRRT